MIMHADYLVLSCLAVSGHIHRCESLLPTFGRRSTVVVPSLTQLTVTKAADLEGIFASLLLANLPFSYNLADSRFSIRQQALNERSRRRPMLCKSDTTVLQQAHDSEGSKVIILDVKSLNKADVDDLVPRMNEVVNWAYRGKYANGDDRAWTGERHLIGGIRTTVGQVRSYISEARARPEKWAVLVALLSDGIPAQARVVGTIRVERNETNCGKLQDDAEIGFFSVDPDLQGAGIGSKLLAAAEDYIKDEMGSRRSILSVLTKRIDLIRYYERKGYESMNEFHPFPPAEAQVGTPFTDDLEFVRLQKVLRLK